MSLFRIVDRDGEMLADADGLAGVTEIVRRAPPGRYHVDEISPRSRRVTLRVAGASPYAMTTVAWLSIQTRGKPNCRRSNETVAAWPALPEVLKAGIVAMVKAVRS